MTLVFDGHEGIQEMEQPNNNDWLYIAFVVEGRNELVYMREHMRWNSQTTMTGYALLLW